MTYSFEVNTRSQSLGIFGLSEDRIQRLVLMLLLMLLLQEKYKMNSVQINDFLNSNNIKTPRNKIYNHKIVWGSIKKYRARLDRYNFDTIDRVKETISYSIDS